MNPISKMASECGINPSNKEENAELFKKIIEGKHAAERLAEGNMAYVVTKVDGFVDEFPEYEYLRDDLISEGFLTLTRIAEKIGEVEEEDFNPQGMLSVCLRNSFLNMVRVERDETLGELNNNDAIVENPLPALDLKLDILALCKDDLDRRIVEYRIQGLNDEETGERTGLDRRRVGERRQALWERFQETQ